LPVLGSAVFPLKIGAKISLGIISGQLQAYLEILQAQSLDVDTAWIHFPLAGVMAVVAGT